MSIFVCSSGPFLSFSPSLSFSLFNHHYHHGCCCHHCCSSRCRGHRLFCLHIYKKDEQKPHLQKKEDLFPSRRKTRRESQPNSLIFLSDSSFLAAPWSVDKWKTWFPKIAPNSFLSSWRSFSSAFMWSSSCMSFCRPFITMSLRPEKSFISAWERLSFTICSETYFSP